ncbi:MAG: phosphodiester glycosidase family protein [Myxococcota bacterium]|nr:phosphodiester glycosidase family protein [Myxococcota bacterium]MEC8422791.1 phosphodiester glycosidase family protein [Myxococcota bacterium]
MVDAGTTLGASTDRWDRYDCAPDTLETGPEVLYRFIADRPGDFRAEVRELDGSDVDLHLLRDPRIEDGIVQGCLGRAHQRLELTGLPAGEYWLAIDSWASESAEFPGAYELAFEWIEEEVWREVEVGPGIRWRTLRTAAEGGQTFQVVSVDPDAGRFMRPDLHSGCESVPDRLDALGAAVGINGGFFNVSNCTALDLVKADGIVLSTNQLNGLPQRAVGHVPGTGLAANWVDPGADWPEASDATSGYPSLVADGVAAAEAEPGVTVYSSTDWSRHPRSAMGITADGQLLLATVAGRTPAGAGLTTPRLADWMVELGAVEAVGLDGGGSSTLVVRGCWVDGVVSHPSDNGLPDWRGARGVSDGVYIY